MKKLAAFDLVYLGYMAIVSLIVIVCRPAGMGIFLTWHAVVVGLLALIVVQYERRGGRFWTFCRYWYVVPFAISAFREIHYLAPLVHNFDDHHYDQVLQAIDRRWFGDVDGFWVGALPGPLVDLLHGCYWFYYVALLIPGWALFSRNDLLKMREYLSVVMLSVLVSYLGYFAVPAIGPHHFLDPRPASLDGWLLGGVMHRLVMAAELRMPDAFPSGHALMSMVVIAMAWRLYRPLFRWVLLPSLGCILATIALRYHYVVDVAASVALFPALILGGTLLHRWWEAVDVSAPQEREQPTSSLP
jgi:hypothetical protein